MLTVQQSHVEIDAEGDIVGAWSEQTEERID